MTSADFVVLVCDATDRRPPIELGRPLDLAVMTKLDLLADVREPQQERVAVSAVTGEGLGVLRARLDRLAFGAPESSSGAQLTLNARHVDAVREACEALGRAASVGGEVSPEVVALELRDALDAMGRVLGSVTPDDLLGRIFSTFCIGK
jgi:tRNA modification GTPase